MEALTDDLIYFRIAWDIFTIEEIEARCSVIDQALRDFDHEKLLKALSICGSVMRASLNQYDPALLVLITDQFMEWAREETQ